MAESTTLAPDPLPFRLRVTGRDTLGLDGIESVTYRVKGVLRLADGDVILEHAPKGVTPARLAGHGMLEKSEGVTTTIVGYGLAMPPDSNAPPGHTSWDGKRRARASKVRRVVDETWALWAIPSYVCHGDSGGAIFLDALPGRKRSYDELVANVSDGGQDCRGHNNNNRLDTRSIQKWIDDTIRRQLDAK